MWKKAAQLNIFDHSTLLKEQLGKKPRLNDAQRRRLAAKAKKIGFKHLKGIATLGTPRTLLDWHQQLIARKYDSVGKRSAAPSAVTDNPTTNCLRSGR